MNAREILCGYIKNRELLEQYRREAEAIQTMLTSTAIDYTKEKVQTSPNGDRMVEAIDKLIALQNEITETMREALEQMEKVQRLITGIKDPVLREILWRRWIQGQKMEAIAEEMRRDLRWIYRLHARALRQIDHVVATGNCI